jgi:hypothetical protein
MDGALNSEGSGARGPAGSRAVNEIGWSRESYAAVPCNYATKEGCYLDVIPLQPVRIRHKARWNTE